MDEVTPKHLIECQQQAYRQLSSSLHQFAIFDDEVSKKKRLNSFQVRELEAYLLAFRDYANLVLMVLKPIVQTFENDRSTHGKKEYPRYSRYLREMATFFIRYSKAAVNAVVKGHTISPCLGKLECGPHKEVWEGWIAAHTADRRTCTCTMDDGTKAECTVYITIRVDMKNSYDPYRFRCPSYKSFTCATKEYAKHVMNGKVNEYVKKDTKVVAAYWQKQLLDFIPVWQKVLRTSDEEFRKDEPWENVYDDEGEGEGEQDDEGKSGAEERRKARLAKAEKELNLLKN